MPRVEPTEDTPSKPDLSPAACVVSRGSSPSLMSRHRQSSDVVVPQTASTVSRRDLTSRSQCVPGSKATKSPSDSKPPPDVAVGRNRTIAGPASSASPVHSPARAQRGAVPASTTCSSYAPRIIFPHRHRGGGGGAKPPMKPAAKASGVAAGGLNEPPCTPVSSDSTEKKSEDEGKTKDSLESVHLSRLQGTRASISIVAKSSPYELSLNATHQRASTGQTMLSEEVLERMHFPAKHAVYVMLDLLINWAVPFWFEMSLRRLPNNARYSLNINRVPMNKWRRQQEVSEDVGHLKEYAKVFYDVYGASKEDRSHIDKLLKLEKDLHAVIEPQTSSTALRYATLDTIQPGALTETLVSIGSTTLFTSSYNSKTWLSFLNELLQPHQFTMEDYILVDDIGLSRTMVEILMQFSNMDMLYTLGWWFAQQFSVMASLNGSIASYGSATTAAANRQSDCYALAESRFRRQLFLQRAHASLGYPRNKAGR
ncbi:hypothetical protein MRX96_059815 [Rhipicephalus microplus]